MRTLTRHRFVHPGIALPVFGLFWLAACSGSDSGATSNNGPATSDASSVSGGTSTNTSSTSVSSAVSNTSTATTGASSTSAGTTASSVTSTGTTSSTTTASSTASSTSAGTSTGTDTASSSAGGAGGTTATTTSSETVTTGGPSGACPDDATFCSSFDENELPEGAVYKLNGDPATPWTTDFEIDTSVFNTGVSSLHVRPNGEGSGAYKMLAVPAPGAAFWVRFYIRSDVDLGDEQHNVFAAAAGSDDPNDSVYVEFAEDVGLSFNSHDIVRWPMDYGRLEGGGTNPYTLPKDTWHCIEISFDGQNRAQQLYINDAQQIDATDYPEGALAFTTFKFGYNALHGTTRNTWYDDVAVAAARIGCL